MKTYTEEDLRLAFQAGKYRQHFEAYATSADDFEMDEDEYIESLNLKDKISFTYSFLRRKIDWEEFCELTGISLYARQEGYEIKDNEIFYIAESKAKQLNLI